MVDDIKLVCFDLNKTLIKENTWYNLNLAMGVTEDEDEDLMIRYENGEITYEEGQRILSKLYRERGKGTKENIEKAINNYKFLEGTKELIRYLTDKEYEIAIVSGSIDVLVEKLAGELKIKLFAAHNNIEFDENEMFKNIRCNGDDKDFKLDALQSFCGKLGIKLTQVVAVGDGDNDLLMFEATRHGITFKGSRIEKAAWKIIDNLTDIKKIL